MQFGLNLKNYPKFFLQQKYLKNTLLLLLEILLTLQKRTA